MVVGKFLRKKSLYILFNASCTIASVALEVLVHKMPKASKQKRHVSTIPPQSTCVSFEIPQNFACSICYDSMNPLMHQLKKRKQERCKSERRKCKKLLDVALLDKTNLTEGEIRNVT